MAYPSTASHPESGRAAESEMPSEAIGRCYRIVESVPVTDPLMAMRVDLALPWVAIRLNRARSAGGILHSRRVARKAGLDQIDRCSRARSGSMASRAACLLVRSSGPGTEQRRDPEALVPVRQRVVSFRCRAHRQRAAGFHLHQALPWPPFAAFLVQDRDRRTVLLVE